MKQQFLSNRLFAGIPAAIVERLSEFIGVTHYETDEVIICEGEAGECLFLVGEGSVRISKKGRGGRQETLCYLMPDDFFGEMSLIDHQPRSAQATAAEPTTLGCLNHEALQKALMLAPEDLSVNFIRTVVNRLRTTDSLFIDEMMRSERLSLVGLMSNTIIHDFINPISVILCANDFLHHKCGSAACVRMTELIKKSLDQMMAMAQELLAFSRGTSTLKLETISVSQLISDVEQQFHESFEAAGIRVVKELAYSGPVAVDPHRFARMLANIFKNAREAMAAGGVLRLGTREEGTDIVFTIRDSGHGIPPEVLSRLFEPFQSFGKASGTGLGMAVAKSVVEAHHGRITAENDDSGGAKFTVRIPREAHVAAPEAAADSSDNGAAQASLVGAV